MPTAERPRVQEIPNIPLGVVVGDVPIDNQTLVDYLVSFGVDTNSEKIKTAGINKRFNLQRLDEEPKDPKTTVPLLALAAARSELGRTMTDPTAIDRIVVASSYPLDGVNSLSGLVNNYLHAFAKPQDVYAACAGSAIALKYIAENAHFGERILDISADHYTAFMKPGDINRTIFSDGAAALFAVYGEDFEITDICPTFHETSTSIQMPVKIAPEGAISYPVPWADHFAMDGGKVLRWVLTGPAFENITNSYHKAKANSPRVFIVFHQGSGRMATDLSRKLVEKGGVSKDALPVSSVSEIGNLASGSALAEFRMLQSKIQLEEGDSVVISSFGAGNTEQTLTAKIKRTIPKSF